MHTHIQSGKCDQAGKDHNRYANRFLTAAQDHGCLLYTSDLEVFESQFSKCACGCQDQLDLCQIGRLADNVDITLHELAVTTSLRTVCTLSLIHI